MALTIQPTILTAIARNESFRGRGLLARFLFALPPNNVGQRRTGLEPMDNATIERYGAFVKRLAVELEAWASDPATLVISPDAAQLLMDFEAELEPRLAPSGDLGVIADWGSKAVGQTIRIAALLHLVGGSGALRKPIDVASMTDAITLMGYYTAHTKAAFVAMGTDPSTVDALYVLEHLKRENIAEFTVRDLHARLGTNRFRKADDLKAALDTLEDNYWIWRKPAVEHSGPGRKPSPVYVTVFTESTQLGGSTDSVDCVNTVTRD
jgi:hypothetical protein